MKIYTSFDNNFFSNNLFKRLLDHWSIGYQMVSTFKYLTNVVSSHSDIYETCVERNSGQKIRLLLRRQSFVKQPLQTHKLVHVPGEEVLFGRSSAFLITLRIVVRLNYTQSLARAFFWSGRNSQEANPQHLVHL